MPGVRLSSYKGVMTKVQGLPNPHFATAGLLVEALAAHDFDALALALDPDATMQTLLPRGFVEWRGISEICDAFETWFGDVDEFEVVDATVGQVGALLQLRWRVRVKGDRFGENPMIAEQYLFAQTDGHARVNHMRLLCSGFWSEVDSLNLNY